MPSTVSAPPAGDPEALDLRERLLAGAVPLSGYAPGDPLDVRLLGIGESHVAWLVSYGESDRVDRVLRIPRHPVDQMPRPMPWEYAALTRVPAEVGTQGLLMSDSADNPLGRRYILSTFVPGQPKPIEEWTDEDLARFAATLVRLHQETGDVHGPVASPESGPLDVVDSLDAAWVWWSGHEPTIVVRPEVRTLWTRVRSFVDAHAGAIANIDRFPLVHADSCATNVLFDNDNVRLIDWEWAEFSDPARDLALIGGEVHGGPWYVPLTPARIDCFLTTYADLAGIPPADRPDLNLRRQTWMVYERFMSWLLVLSRERTHPDSSYAATSTMMQQTLERFLGVD
ncbi:MAG: phosphotransferase [Propionibacteriaceae bacterium]|nr:phosphotransferase [Propionibacteriaceae bacterium]